MTPKRYALQRFHNSAAIKEVGDGEYVKYTDYERIKARSDRMEALILKTLDVWWSFVHGTHASEGARNLRKELSDAIQPE